MNVIGVNKILGVFLFHNKFLTKIQKDFQKIQLVNYSMLKLQTCVLLKT